MRLTWGIIFLLASVSLETAASPVAPDKMNGPRSPFSIDRQVKSDTSESRADVYSKDSGCLLTLNENALLSQEVKKWAENKGYKLLWKSEKDYIIYKQVQFNGKSSEEVLRLLGELFSSEQYGLVVKLYSGNNVLVVESQ